MRGTETPPQTTSYVKQFLWRDQCELKRTNQKTVKGPPHPFGVGNPKRALVVAGKAINQLIDQPINLFHPFDNNVNRIHPLFLVFSLYNSD